MDEIELKVWFEDYQFTPLPGKLKVWHRKCLAQRVFLKGADAGTVFEWITDHIKECQWNSQF